MGRGRGRGGRGGGRGRGGRGGKDNSFIEREDMNNAEFEEYYRAQKLIPDEEWPAFLETLRTPLPITFRINGSGKFAFELREKFENDFFAKFQSGAIMIDGEPVPAPKSLPWYPDKLAWQLNFSRGQLRKLPWLSAIHEFLKIANEAGSITRQEAVSMVPPLLLDVAPSHRVLDMCAAPGSKTFQLLEALHGGGDGDGEDAGGDASDGGAPRGFVIANDADAVRCNLLTHQTKRMCSPCLMVSNHGAESMPRVTLPPPAADADARPGGRGAEAALDALRARAGVPDGGVVTFDRILCDVPCSGDGTMRKAPDIWRRWSVANGNGLHWMQVRIALQAARLLAVGGRMVYSTCTPNPIEDEAVVAELLERCGGALRLVDVSDRLPALKRLPGLNAWRVRDKYQWYDSWDDAKVAGNKLDPSMFSTPAKAALGLERCMRIMPHHQDSGGFFVAVIEKVAAIDALLDPVLTHRFARTAASGGGADPLTGARAAAEYALAAAGRAVDALEARDGGAVAGAAASAAAGAAKVALAAEAAQAAARTADGKVKQQEKRGKKQQEKKGKQAAAKAAEEEAGEEAEAEEAADGGDEDGAAAMDVEDGDDDDGVVAAAAAKEEEEDGEAGKAADGKAADGAAPPKTSWARGGGGRGRSGGGGRFGGIDPVLPVEDPAILEPLASFYGISDAFPLRSHLITRSLEAALPKRIYYVSGGLLALLLADTSESLKVVSTGLKLFERHELKGKATAADGADGAATGGAPCCSYRIAQEGLPFLLPYIGRQLLRVRAPEFLRLLRERNLPIRASRADADAEAAGETPPPPEAVEKGFKGGAVFAPGGSSRQALLDSPDVLAQLDALAPGGAVVVLHDDDARDLGFATVAGGGGEAGGGALTVNAPIAVCAWLTRASLGVLVAKAEGEALSDKLKAAQRRAAGGGGKKA